jgi:hypothetical protein
VGTLVVATNGGSAYGDCKWWFIFNYQVIGSEKPGGGGRSVGNCGQDAR